MFASARSLPHLLSLLDHHPAQMLSRTMLFETRLLAASCPSLTKNAKDGAASSVAMQGWASPQNPRMSGAPSLITLIWLQTEG